MLNKADVHIFAGPSLLGSGLDPSSYTDIHWLPPVRRGDVVRLREHEKEPSMIAIADGTFHAYPSVSHEEIRSAINAGWQVYGMCSMGAIRASEMRHMGMIAWGRVASMFCENPWLADDEVALIHENESPYIALSEPLIHLREFLNWASRSQILNRTDVTQITEALRERWYGERTLSLLHAQLRGTLGVTLLPDELQSSLANFNHFRLKQQDLASFVKSCPWRWSRQ